MARPSRYETSALLDTALDLATAGPAAVTMSAVAKAAGAPSGSVYHRFPDRPALLSALWLRTLEHFQAGFLEALGSDPEPRRAAVAAARQVVEWSRAQPAEARVLRYGAADFGLTAWPAEAKQRLRTANERTTGAVLALARQLGARDPVAIERVTVAVIDVPYALVQRHLRAGTAVPAHTLTTVEECTAALLP